MEQLFVYGTLMNPKVQQKVFGRTVAGRPDHLAGYKKERIKLGRNVYPIIKPEATSHVAGVILTVSTVELALIDHYEGKAYQRKKVALTSGRRAWVYQQPG